MAMVWQALQENMGWWLGMALVVLLLVGMAGVALCKGWLGAWRVRCWLARDLDGPHYRCLHKVSVRWADGRAAQIDHVVVSPYGVFVLAVLHGRGRIWGSAPQPSWTQTLRRHRSSFPNPLRQNWRHIKALEAVLQVPLQHLHSVVVFTGDCTFQTAMPACVTLGRASTAFIQRSTEAVFTAAQVALLVQTLSGKGLQASRSTAAYQGANVPTLQGPLLRQKAMPRTAAALVRPVPALAPVRLLAPDGCPVCGEHLERRSLPDAQGTPHYFLRCEAFSACGFVRAESSAAA